MKKKRLWLTSGAIAGLLLVTLAGGRLVSVHGDSTPTASALSVPTKVKTSAQTATVDKLSGTVKNAKVTYRQAGQTGNTATFNKTTSSTDAKAAAKIGAQDHSGETVKLKDGTQAKEQGVMGHIYVTWKKGNWSVTTVTDTTQTLRTAPTTLASQVDNQLKQQQITNQKVDKGAVTVYSTAQEVPANQITWQNNKQVSSVKTQQANTAYAIAKSVLN
ncbi:hypothetical protein [Secundilactobacillus folii]|uniref:Uncharacterized protein n=1 Tax=Secundilactobacillus folii TaxID=2678357 RepID=A0A7X2XWV0_9LACO|nr:hypothetical protein [Secundilactobacillus folii]MTV81771.1 hypothetical protein [Secundilactobacillus folii]